MRTRNDRTAKGQSAVEFLLVGPVLFLIFFSILQLAYLGLSAMAVQRAANAIAREASFSAGDEDQAQDRLRGLLQRTLALTPLSALDRERSWVCAACAQVGITRDRTSVTVTVRYPMPIWVPGVQHIFGQSLIPPGTSRIPEDGGIVSKILSLFSVPVAPVSAGTPRRLSVRWLTFSATVFDESQGGLP